MKTFILILCICILSPVLAMAEPFQADATEVNASAASNLARTCFYYCTCKQATTCTCNSWAEAGSPHCIESDDGNGLDNISHTWNIRLYQGDLPVTIRYTATSVTTTGNESTKGSAVQTYTFPAP